jgi:hypothetical protein
MLTTKERMEVSSYQAKPEPEISGWAIGGVTFAAVIMVLLGIFQAFAGLAAILEDEFFVVGANYVYDLDVTAWGWIHLAVGVLVGLSGLYLFAGRLWAGVVAITLAALSAVANFFFIAYYPWWAVLQIALAVWVIWALTRPGVLRE